MNTARLGNLWAQASGDTHKMAEALGEELKAEFATKADLYALEARLYRAMGAQTIAIVTLNTAMLALFKLF